MFPAVMVERWMEMGIYFGSVPFPPLLHVKELPEFASLMSLDRSGPDVCFGMVGCLGLVVLLLGIQPLVSLNGAWVLIQLTTLATGRRLSVGMRMILHWRWRIIPIFGPMVAGRISLQLVGSRLLALVSILHAAEVSFDCSVWGTAEEYGDARLERCRAFLPVPGVMQTVQRAEFWVLLLPCRRTGLVI